ncbi:tRNA (adenosine(37)-N6)-dimethylallyltransferase MiaA [Anaeromicropila populeti]|uniref:tRNA dimethylallyltransferase n=1 Tax=Anaeromicropila populeti TaxID=37658 RepID=A0A1I6L7L6_9FIRM|nr:tRNA (adenosine(37)-N6)-dimethylallyltransferase MiaA [Anaeromicropila populeti]SFR99491.1 tRNA dimethylallyltransferase [Anaeromicropila populeti]
MKKPLIILTGPTAVGKTDLSIALAKEIGGEIISADSMQVYKDMNIGTAKITKEEMQGVPHYLIDVLEPSDDFNIVLFQNYALKYLDEIYQRGKIPIVAGGTGFYIQALLYDVAFEENDADMAYREELEHLAQINGASFLHAMLKEVDPASCQIIHENNIKRTIRALEFYKKTGMPISQHNATERQRSSPYNFVYFVLTDNREQLYERINLRVDKMVEKGLVEEVAALMEKGYHEEMVSMQGIGYKEMIRYLKGDYSLEEAIYLIKRETRHFAKRQLTWFRREKEVLWLNKEEFGQDDARILEKMKEILLQREII